MKIIYQSNDGNLFDSESDCLTHEKLTALRTFISEYINHTHNADAGFDIIEVSDVEEFIRTYNYQIQNML